MAARISCGVGFPKWNPQSEFISDEENSKFQGIFMPMDTLHPEETGAAKLTLQSKVLDPCLLLCPLVKGLNEMSL